jgi:hypothetical protein
MSLKVAEIITTKRFLRPGLPAHAPHLHFRCFG